VRGGLAKARIGAGRCALGVADASAVKGAVVLDLHLCLHASRPIVAGSCGLETFDPERQRAPNGGGRRPPIIDHPPLL
jgi:hypothetical protein